MGFRRRTRRRAIIAGAAIAHHEDKKAGEQQQADDQVPADDQQDQAPADDGQDQAQYAPPAADPADEIEHLAQLHSSGALSDDEFAAAKAKILGT
jgi:Short C-terminal domain